MSEVRLSACDDDARMCVCVHRPYHIYAWRLDEEDGHMFLHEEMCCKTIVSRRRASEAPAEEEGGLAQQLVTYEVPSLIVA